MSLHRTEQIASVIRLELNRLLLRIYEPPKGSIVTIEEVHVSPDLSHAKIFVSVFPLAQSQTVIDALSGRQHEFWHESAKRIFMKKLPKFEFVLDEREERADRINRLLDSEE